MPIIRSTGVDAFQVRILRLDRIIKLGEPALIAVRFVGAVLVADLDIGQRERRGMTVLHTLGAPFGARIASDVFDFVQRIIHEGLQSRPGINMLSP